MQYRQFRGSDFMVSTFGMGNMRLPTTTNDKGENVIDRPEAIKMIRHAIDSGVNYLDTAYVYHGGESEVVVGEALKDGYRERVKIATKLPVDRCKTPEDMDKILQESMDRLGVDYIDYYLLHGMRKENWEYAKKLGALEFLDRAKADGRIKNACFSFHDNYDLFCEILDSYDWDMAQIQMNYLDIDNQATVRGMKYAAEKGVAIVIMEPLRGGRLANVPKEISDIFASYSGEKRSPVEWAFRWLYNQPEVTVILSGVSTYEQLCDNLDIFDRSGIGVMTEEEEALIMKAKAAIENRIAIPCTGCNYCMPCPNGLQIPTIFRMYNQGYMFDDFGAIKRGYDRLKENGGDASHCVGCGACEAACPQHIEIIDWMSKIREADFAN